MQAGTWTVAALVGFGALFVAWTPAHGHPDVTRAALRPVTLASFPTASAAASAEQDKRVVIEHLVPRRDSSGPMPKRFEWTPVKGADHYAMGVWSEVDVLVWRSGEVTTPFVDVPKDVVLDSGTYFWSITALRDGRPIADSGNAAFIVVR